MASTSRKDKMALQRLRDAAEKAKIELSGTLYDRNQPAVHHDGCVGPKTLIPHAHPRQTRKPLPRPHRADRRALPQSHERRRPQQ